MPRTNEVALNAQLAEVLRLKHPLWRKHLHVEQTGIFPDHPLLRPDILVHPPNAQPVVLETEYGSAHTVEGDAIRRLGLTPLNSSDPVEHSIAVRIPVSLQESQENLKSSIEASTFQYCVLSGDPKLPNRMPTNGWLEGGIDDIVRCIEFAMVSQRVIDESMKILERGVRNATRAIQDASETGFSDIESALGEVLNQRPGEQTNRMAMTIIANGLTFHSMIAGTQDIPTVLQLREDLSSSLQLAIIDTWSRILGEINYWPIFKVASDLLVRIPSPTAKPVLDALVAVASQLAEIGVTTRHDLSGRMFQNLIVDRKFLATFYTLPTSAALLAELAVSQLAIDWKDLQRYTDLRIADLSCGTGTLLSAAYHSVLTRYRHAGGDDRLVHRGMIEKAIVAADIMPAAVHLCASQLSSVHPTITFNNTRVYTMPYGVGTGDERDRGLAIGSLDLITSEHSHSILATGQRQASGSHGDVEVSDIDLPHDTVDLVIMNPPFTRPTNHAVAADIPVPSFAGFLTSNEEQSHMSERLSQIRKKLDRPASHGNAGLASNFIDLAHKKVKSGGTIALVLPISVTSGASWKPARDLLSRDYTNIVVVTIAAARNSLDRSFSADTTMAEALILATKCKPNTMSDGTALFVNLHQRPTNLLEAAETGKLVTKLPANRRTGRIYAGQQELGSYIRAPLSEGGCAALREVDLADSMIGLKAGELRLPRYLDSASIPITTLDHLGTTGRLHRDIGSKNEQSPNMRGPFWIRPIHGAASYPTLWSHHADHQRSLIVHPDCTAEIRPGYEESAKEVWQTATRLHFSLGFRFTSQSLAACVTPDLALGGSAWPNFRPKRNEWENILALWANCTLGLMCYWWIGSRQHAGRSIVTLSSLPDVLSIDPRKLPADKISLATELFSTFHQIEFLPANEAYRDPARQALDRAILVDILELSEDILKPLNTLRLQWCSEPTVHGGKNTAPAPR